MRPFAALFTNKVWCVWLFKLVPLADEFNLLKKHSYTERERETHQRARELECTVERKKWYVSRDGSRVLFAFACIPWSLQHSCLMSKRKLMKILVIESSLNYFSYLFIYFSCKFATHFHEFEIRSPWLRNVQLKFMGEKKCWSKVGNWEKSGACVSTTFVSVSFFIGLTFRLMWQPKQKKKHDSQVSVKYAVVRAILIQVCAFPHITLLLLILNRNVDLLFFISWWIFVLS